MNQNLTPKAIVAALDAHIVGQTDAKRAVAVALRNRWRRQQLAPELRDEVSPKNILMIGPTGCGKTEISRRLAKLADAPFVKVGQGRRSGNEPPARCADRQGFEHGHPRGVSQALSGRPSPVDRNRNRG